METMKVKGHDHLRKNRSSGAIINTNRANYMARRAKKHREREQADKIETLQSELREIKELLSKVIKDGN